MKIMEELELRMYFFVPYQLTGIQQGIQSGHAALEFALKYGRYNPNHIIWDFIEKYKTWVILNGGTTNSGHRGSVVGSLNVIENSISIYNLSADVNDKIDVERFFEPDLNDTMTAVCFICDERVFNKVKYPDYEGYGNDFADDYDEWLESIGGEKNVFLRELIKDKKLA
jgi:hypothetical protein